MARLHNDAPVELRGLKGACIAGVGNPLAFSGVIESGKMSELISPARGNSSSQILLEITEKEKWCFSPELFTHEEQRRGRRKQEDLRRRAYSTAIRNLNDPLAECPVSDLVMILKERDKCSRRQALGGFTARFAIPVEGNLALVRESVGKTTAQLIDWTLRIVRIITVPFTSDQHVQRVVDVVVPLGGVRLRLAALGPLKVTRLVVVVFQDKVDVAIRLDGAADGIGQFCEDVGCGVVDDRVNRVQTQSVELVFGQPVERVVDEEVPHDFAVGAIEVEAVSPGSRVPISKELWRVRPEIISFRAKVVVDNIQQNHQSAVMGTLNQLFEIFGSAVSAIRSEGEDAVVTPVALAGKVGDWHQLHGSDSQIRKIVEPLAHGGERPGRGEGSHVQFIENSLFPPAAVPVAIMPVEGPGVDNFAGSTHVPSLKPGGWVGDFLPSIDPEMVFSPRLGRIGG